MSKTTTPPPKKTLDGMGIRFVPTNCYSPNHWAVKHLMFPFAGGKFDTHDEYTARREAALVQTIAMLWENNGRREDINFLIAATLRIMGSTSDHTKFKPA